MANWIRNPQNTPDAGDFEPTDAEQLEAMAAAHNDYVDREISRARRGETICLTDLMISQERVILAREELNR